MVKAYGQGSEAYLVLVVKRSSVSRTSKLLLLVLWSYDLWWLVHLTLGANRRLEAALLLWRSLQRRLVSLGHHIGRLRLKLLLLLSLLIQLLLLLLLRSNHMLLLLRLSGDRRSLCSVQMRRRLLEALDVRRGADRVRRAGSRI